MSSANLTSSLMWIAAFRSSNDSRSILKNRLLTACVPIYTIHIVYLIIRLFVYLVVRLFVYSVVRLFVYSFIRLFGYSCMRIKFFIYSCSFIRLFVFVYSFIRINCPIRSGFGCMVHLHKDYLCSFHNYITE